MLVTPRLSQNISLLTVHFFSFPQATVKGGGLATVFQSFRCRVTVPVTYSNAEQLLELNIFSTMLYVAGTKYRKNFMQGLGGGPAHEPIHIPQTFSHQASPLD